MVFLVLVDMEFERKEEDKPAMAVVNTKIARENAGKIERDTRLVKERYRCVIATLSLRYYHKMLVVHLVYFICIVMNGVPAAKDILKIFSSHKIVTSRRIDVKKESRAVFSSYVEASIDADVANDITTQTHGYLSLGPSGNL